MNKTSQFNGTVAEILKKSDVSQSYNPDSENPISAKAAASALGNYLPIDREIEIELDGGDAGGELEIEFVVDSAMSDTSSNPVENRVAKRYIDDAVNNIAHEEGIVGNWHYIKTPDGNVELWGYVRFNDLPITNAHHGAYASDGFVLELPFPVYADVDNFVISIGHVSNGMWLSNSWVESGTNLFRYTVARVTAATAEAGDIRIYIKGRWKEWGEK